ncbi:MAG: glutathione S-transferase family protein [Pseudomonadota bacterium]|nr:glutathione S-transferase family protein [Pseudomonadota bacterium]
MNILLSFRRCPYAIRARMALHLMKINFETLEVNLKQKPAILHRLSPDATVPVLCLLKSKQILKSSDEIVAWCMGTKILEPWTNHRSSEQEALCRYLYRRLNTDYIPAFNRYKYWQRYDDVNRSLELKQIDGYMRELDSVIGSTNSILREKSELDIMIYPFVRQWDRYVECPALDSHYPKVASWYHDISRDEYTRCAMAKNMSDTKSQEVLIKTLEETFR